VEVAAAAHALEPGRQERRISSEEERLLVGLFRDLRLEK
jgi:hypothetical protein